MEGGRFIELTSGFEAHMLSGDFGIRCFLPLGREGFVSGGFVSGGFVSGGLVFESGCVSHNFKSEEVWNYL